MISVLRIAFLLSRYYPFPILKHTRESGIADILFINGIYSYRFTIAPLLFAKVSRKIVSVRGMLHPGALSQKKWKKKIYLFLWKALGLYKRCDFHATSQQEKTYIENIFGKKVKIFVAQNFPRIFPRLLYPEKIKGSLKIISIALISSMKNHLEVIRALKNCSGNIQYNIYGPVKDPGYWDSCIKEIKKLNTNTIVNYNGDIPPGEVKKVLSENHVFILPSKSENFGHAIFEALSAGKPVITSIHTPWTNLKATEAGINIDLEYMEQLHQAINFFADMDQVEYDLWSRKAKQHAENAINLDEIRTQYKHMFLA